MEIKDKIARAAGELFMQHGVKNVSMDEIAGVLGMSKRTIYLHFSDKEDILIYFLEYIEKREKDGIQQIVQSVPTVVHAFLQILEMHQDLESQYNIKFQEDIEKFFPKANQLWIEQRERSTILTKQYLEEGIKQGVIREGLNLEVIAFLLQDTNNTYLHASRMMSRPFTIWELFRTMFTNFIRGISTYKGIEIIDEYLANYKN